MTARTLLQRIRAISTLARPEEQSGDAVGPSICRFRTVYEHADLDSGRTVDPLDGSSPRRGPTRRTRAAVRPMPPEIDRFLTCE